MKFGLLLGILAFSFNVYATESAVYVVSIESGETSSLNADEDIQARLGLDADYGICFTGSAHAAFRDSLSSRVESLNGFTGYNVENNQIVLLGLGRGNRVSHCSSYRQ